MKVDGRELQCMHLKLGCSTHDGGSCISIYAEETQFIDDGDMIHSVWVHL